MKSRLEQIIDLVGVNVTDDVPLRLMQYHLVNSIMAMASANQDRELADQCRNYFAEFSVLPG